MIERVTRIGQESGSAIRRYCSKSEAPSTLAASNNS